KLDLRQARSPEDAHPGLPGVKLAERPLQLFDGCRFRQLHVDRGQDAPRNRQQMRRKLQRAAFKSELLQHLSRVPVAKDVVGGKVAVHFHEVRLGCGLLPCPGDAGLGIADDTLLQVHEPGANPRRQGENDGRRIAPWISQQRGMLDSICVQLRQTVNRRIVQFRHTLRESIHLPVRCLLQPPSAAQINHAETVADRLRHKLARELVRRRKEDDIHSGTSHSLPREALEGEAAVARQLWIDIAEIAVFAALAIAPEQQGFLHSSVPGEQAHQLESGIAGGAKDRGLYASIHIYARYPRIRCASFPADFALDAIARIVSSPPMVPTDSSHSSASMAAETGCALPGLVFTTTRFCAVFTSYTNSWIRRSIDGRWISASSP